MFLPAEQEDRHLLGISGNGYAGRWVKSLLFVIGSHGGGTCAAEC